MSGYWQEHCEIHAQELHAGNGYSQKAIAAMLNVHRNTIRNWAMHK
ncbi:helix-turn-helix domain-containing protein [Escherichia coli]